MAFATPQASSPQNNPSHSLLHRILDIDTSAAEQSVVIDASGNVGIGTTNPTQTLEIVGTLYTGTSAGYGDSNYRWSQYSGDAGDITGGLKMRNGGGSINSGISIRQTVGGQGHTDLVTILTDVNQTSDFYISTSNSGVVAEKFRVTGAGNIGIGTASPSSKLHIYNGSSGATPYSNSHLIIENNGRTILSLLAPDSYDNYIMFGSPASSNRAFIGYTNSANANPDIFTLSTSGKFSLTGGKVGIGTINALSSLHIYDGASGATPVAGYSFLIEDNTSTGIQILTPDANQGTLLFGTASDAFGAYVRWDYTSDLMTIGTANSGADIALLTGNGVEAVRILDSGLTGIGTSTPTAVLHLKAGTASANTAPLKFTAGINLTTPEAGVIEFDGTDFYFTV